ncbi:DarT ssDNA thymidine ADP-ribosyltransferase family protein [Segeticoccus rhizosphaerae]|uniref:DarT ssDNA thymidine ADP-ribosyltransferase family protein n=1 Tax=Segeticoccus rhizosphaerae TaxID=1104777 RepID=UPI0010BF9381|nr:DarT ssDNA thymidine ADP-ribosyltransferase family protein [Ornithinicoccus soli]
MTPPMTVAQKIAELGLTRVVHFTPAKNLHHIIADGQITSNKVLAEYAPEYFDPTDPHRLDDHPDMTCVTFTYPNPFYFDTARTLPQFRRFPDWVCLLIKADVLTRDGVLFCECNAAKGGGAYLRAGVEGLAACFADTTLGYERGPTHHRLAATDLQAEALVPGPIPLSDVAAIVTPTGEAAGNGQARLRAGDLDPDQFTWLVSAKMFTKWPLTNAIQSGQSVLETPWIPGEEED